MITSCEPRALEEIKYRNQSSKSFFSNVRNNTMKLVRYETRAVKPVSGTLTERTVETEVSTPSSKRYLTMSTVAEEACTRSMLVFFLFP